MSKSETSGHSVYQLIFERLSDHRVVCLRRLLKHTHFASPLRKLRNYSQVESHTKL